MIRSNVWVCGVVLLLVILPGISGANAQEQRPVKRTVGLAGLINSGQSEILVPIWLGDRFVLAPALSLLHIENIGTQVGLGAAARFYLYMERIAPYLGVQGFALVDLPEVGSSATDLTIGVFFGGEFFLHQRFSVGIQAHGDLFIPDSGSYVFNTSTSVLANIYF